MQNLSSWNSTTTESTTPSSSNNRRHYGSQRETAVANSRKTEPVLSGDALVGNDLLDHVTRGYSDLSIRTQSTTPVSSRSGGRSYKPDTPNLSLGGVLFHETGHGSPRPQHHHSSEADLSIWGRNGNSNMERSTSVGEPSSMFHHHRHAGMGSHTQQHRLENSPLVRSQSAAPLVGPPPGILSDPVSSRPPSSLTPSWELPRSISAGSIDEPAVRPAAKTLMELIQEDVPPPANAGILGYGAVDDDELSPHRLDRSPQDSWQQQRQLSSGQMLQQGSTTYISRDAPSFVPGEPSHHQQVNAYYPQQPQQIQGQRQTQPQQHVVYGNGMQQQQQRDVHEVRIQTVPGNQQVYMNPPQGYGYAPVSFPAPGSQQRQPQQQQQQFVSVMSMPGGGQQVSYWPPGPSSIPGDSYQPQQQSQQQSHHHHHHMESSPVVSPMSQHYRREKSTGGRGGRRPRGRVDSKGSASSVLLEEFRASKSRDWTIRRIEGHISEFCQDQNGSRFIQQRLEMGDIMEQQVVMKEVLPAIRTLRTDVFGNYVVQKLLDFGTPKMKQEIKATLEGEMLQLSLQMYGCRVVQKAMETLDEDDLPRLLREFHHNVLNCIHDQNGNHVIQKCIEVLYTRARKASDMGDQHRSSFLNEQVDFIIDDVLVNTTSLSCHPYGCRVLQRMLEHCPQQRKMQVLDEIKLCHKTLLDDQYGNYVIQHVLQYGRDEDRDSLLHIIAENGLLRLSRQKFASNVVEKLLKYGNGNQRRGIVREMLKITEDPAMYVSQPHKRVSVVLLMVRDAYANYVVQTTLDVVPESDERRLLLKELNAHVEELRNYTFAKHIVVKLAALSERS